MIQIHFEGMFISGFKSWNDAFEYIDKKVNKRTADVSIPVEIQTQDKANQVRILKTKKSGEGLAGCLMELYNGADELIDSWTSTEEAHVIANLSAGTYRLHEVKAVSGYKVAKDITFEVKDTDELTEVTMVDEKKPNDTPSGAVIPVEAGKLPIPNTGDQ